MVVYRPRSSALFVLLFCLFVVVALLPSKRVCMCVTFVRGPHVFSGDVLLLMFLFCVLCGCVRGDGFWPHNRDSDIVFFSFRFFCMCSLISSCARVEYCASCYFIMTKLHVNRLGHKQGVSPLTL